MTPKDKAQELVEKYAIWLWNDNTGVCDYKKAKELALIAVHQIIKALRKDVAEIGQGKGYWAQVKIEIQKI